MLSGSDRGRLKLLLALAAAGLLWRIVVSFVLVPAWETRNAVPAFPDQYPELAQSLLERGTLGYDEGRATITTARGPGFPLWVALGMLVGGNDGRWLGLWSGVPALILGSVIAGMLHRRYGVLPAATAYAIVTCHPLPSVLGARVLSDEFYAACGFGAVLLWIRVLRSPEGRWWPLAVGAGILLALQLLTRSTGVLTLIVMLAAGWMAKPRRWRACLVLACVAMIPALAWSVRSSKLEGRAVFVHSLAGYNFWVGEAFDRFGSGWTEQRVWTQSMALIGEKGGLDADSSVRFHYAKLLPHQMADLDQRLTREAIQRIASDPTGYLARVMRGLPRFWFEAQSRRRTLQIVAAMLPLMILMCIGAWTALRIPGPKDLVVVMSLCLIVSHNVAYAATLPMARMSVQIFPELAWLCAAGVAAVWVAAAGSPTDNDRDADP